MTRAEKVAQAQKLRGEGLKLREIATRMGANLKTVHTWLSDPDLSKQRARREGYRGTCVDCGKPTDGSRGAANAPERCSPCTNTHNAKWGTENVVAAMRRFAERYGRPPAATDFNPPHAISRGQAWRAERFHRDGDYPYSATVVNEFGSWNAGIAAAGFDPRPLGGFFVRETGTHRAAHLELERPAA